MVLTLDEAYERMHRTGPEFDGWLSNHGPMAADAILRLGHGDILDGWLDRYTSRLDAAPTQRWSIEPADWQEYLGDPSRLGDWTDLLSRQVREASWRDVLAMWWPRLLPGSIAAATHGLIRTGHAVRALLEQETGPRLDELGDALGYWAARWQPLPLGDRGTGREAESPPERPGPGTGAPGPTTVTPHTWAARLASAPRLTLTGGARTRQHQLDASRPWSAFLRQAPEPQPAVDDIPAAIDGLVDAAIASYAAWAHGNPVMLVHAATAPRAAGLCLPALPHDLWAPTLEWAWHTSVTITALYRPRYGDGAPAGGPDTGPVGLCADRAVQHGDEHVIKLTEVAMESSRRGQPGGRAVEAAMAQIPSDG